MAESSRLRRLAGRVGHRLDVATAETTATLGTAAFVGGFCGVLGATALGGNGALGLGVGVVVGLAWGLRALSAPISQVGWLQLPVADEVARNEVVVLRTPRPSDGPAVEASIDDRVLQANGLPVEFRRQVTALVRSPIVSAEHGYLMVTTPEDDAVGGVVSYSPAHSPADSLLIGVWMGPTHRGRGLTAPAVALAASVAMERGAAGVYLGTSEDNVAMRKAAEKAGGRVVLDAPHHLPDGTSVPSVWYQLAGPSTGQE